MQTWFKTNQNTLLANLCKEKRKSVTTDSEQTQIKDVDYYQIVSPVKQVEDKEDGREEVHGNPEQSKDESKIDF